MALKNSPQPERTSRWIPFVLFSGLGVAVVVNGIFVWFALTSWTGLTTEDHYQKGLHYNDALAAQDQQNQLGWTAKVTFEPDDGAGVPAGSASGRLLVTVQDRDGRPVTDLAMVAAWRRPTHEGYDQDLALRATGAGRYTAAVDVPLLGIWDVHVQAARRSDRYQTHARLYVK